MSRLQPPNRFLLHLHAICMAAALASPFAANATIYSCVDAKGTRLTSDRPIPECNDRVQNEHNKSGTIKRQIAPQLTAQERAAKEVQDQKAAEARAQQTEDRKRERALLARYPNRPAHDRERAAAVAQLDEVIKTADKRIAELKLQRKKLDEEAAFHKNNPAKMPPAIKRQIEDNDQQQAGQRRFIADKDAERKRVHMKFDEELDQLRRLWTLQAPGGAASGTK